MPQVPLLRPREVCSRVRKPRLAGVRQQGSHILLTKPGSVATLSVPDHPQVARGTLRALIAKAGLSVEQFLAALKS